MTLQDSAVQFFVNYALLSGQECAIGLFPAPLLLVEQQPNVVLWGLIGSRQALRRRALTPALREAQLTKNTQSYLAALEPSLLEQLNISLVLPVL